MKVTVIYSCAGGESLFDVYVPERGDTVPFVGTLHLGRVTAVRQSARKVEVDIKVSGNRRFHELPGLTP
jgi:hypothetical protein